MRAARSIARGCMAPTSSGGRCSGTGVIGRSGKVNRLPVNGSRDPDHARRMSATPSSSRLGRCRSSRPNAANSVCQ